MPQSSTQIFFKDSYGFVMAFKLTNMRDTTNVRLEITRPDNTVVTRNLTSADINLPAKTISYEVQQGDLNQKGRYKTRLFDTTPGRFVPSAERAFIVKEL